MILQNLKNASDKIRYFYLLCFKYNAQTTKKGKRSRIVTGIGYNKQQSRNRVSL